MKFVGVCGGIEVARCGFVAWKRKKPKALIWASCFETPSGDTTELSLELHEGRMVFTSSHGLLRPFFRAAESCTELRIRAASKISFGSTLAVLEASWCEEETLIFDGAVCAGRPKACAAEARVLSPRQPLQNRSRSPWPVRSRFTAPPRPPAAATVSRAAEASWRETASSTTSCMPTSS